MSTYSQWVKFIMLSLCISSMGLGSSAYAQGNQCSGFGCLRVIAENTYAVLEKVNGLPGYLVQATESLISVIAPDDSDASAEMQSNFTTLGNQLINNNNMQNDPSLLLQINASAFGKTPSDFQASGMSGKPVMATKPFNPNDLTYSTLLGLPPLQKQPADPNNYLKFASGINVTHAMPETIWKAKAQGNDYNRYLNYYNTLLSVETFNGYVLNNVVAEYTNGNQQTNLQNTLISQATDPGKWFQTISTQKIGVVLRQILLYESQLYVLLSQMVLTQKQMLTAQVMTNTLLIAANQDREDVMATRAQGLSLTP